MTDIIDVGDTVRFYDYAVTRNRLRKLLYRVKSVNFSSESFENELTKGQFDIFVIEVVDAFGCKVEDISDAWGYRQEFVLEEKFRG